MKSNNSKTNALRQSKDSALTGASVAKETIKEEEVKENQEEASVPKSITKQESVASKKSTIKSQKTDVNKAALSEKSKQSPKATEPSKKATEPIV
jgi:hypothetical protein